MFENSDWKEQRTATTRQEIMRKFALRDEILKDKKRHLSRLTSVLHFSESPPETRASPPELLDTGNDDPYDRPCVSNGSAPLIKLSFVSHVVFCL